MYSITVLGCDWKSRRENALNDMTLAAVWPKSLVLGNGAVLSGKPKVGSIADQKDLPERKIMLIPTTYHYDDPTGFMKLDPDTISIMEAAFQDVEKYIAENGVVNVFIATRGVEDPTWQGSFGKPLAREVVEWIMARLAKIGPFQLLRKARQARHW